MRPPSSKERGPNASPVFEGERAECVSRRRRSDFGPGFRVFPIPMPRKHFPAVSPAPVHLHEKGVLHRFASLVRIGGCGGMGGWSRPARGWRRGGTEPGLAMGWGNPGKRVKPRCGRASEHRNRVWSRISSQTQRATRPRGILIQVCPEIRVESRERAGCTHPLRDWTRQAGHGFRALDSPGGTGVQGVGREDVRSTRPRGAGTGIPSASRASPSTRPVAPGTETDEEPERGFTQGV